MLKKVFCYYIIFCLVIIGILVIPDKQLVFANVVSNYENVKYTFYTSTNQKVDNAVCINVGYGCIIDCEVSNAKQIKRQLTNITGESFSFSCVEPDEVFYILDNLKAKIVSVEQVDDIKIIYGYINNLSNYIIDNGNKVNIQIAYKNKLVTVGYPIILGSY